MLLERHLKRLFSFWELGVCVEDDASVSVLQRHIPKKNLWKKNKKASALCLAGMSICKAGVVDVSA